MAQTVNEMLQGVGMVAIATFATVILARVGISRLFR
jgi:hypothetical protein